MKPRTLAIGVSAIILVAIAAAFFVLPRTRPDSADSRPRTPNGPVPAAEVRLETANIASSSTSLLVNVNYPRLSGPEEIVGAFNERVQADVNERISEITKELGANSPPPDIPDWMFSLSAEDRTALQTPRLVSVIMDWGVFTGGAHPNSFYTTYAYDLERGRLLELMDVFEPGTDETTALNALARLVRADLLKREFMDESTVEAGTAPKIENFQWFAVTRDGLLVLFPPYQVAAYAAGPQEVLVTWGALPELNERLAE